MFAWLKKKKEGSETKAEDSTLSCFDSSMTFSEQARKGILELREKLTQEVIDDPRSGDGADSVAYRAGYVAGMLKAVEVIEYFQSHRE